MNRSFSALEALSDKEFLFDLEQKFSQYRRRTGQSGSDDEEENGICFPKLQLLSSPSSSSSFSTVHITPETDFEVCQYVYDFLKSQYLSAVARDFSQMTNLLGRVLKAPRDTAKLKNRVPLQQQTELLMLWRTLSVFLSSDDLSLAIEFFRKLQSNMETFPPLSLSTYWKNASTCLVDIPTPKSVLDHEQISDPEEIPLLSHPELAYLNISAPAVDEIDDNNANSVNTDSATTVNLLDHDPLGIIQKFADVIECLALAIPSTDRHMLLSVGITMGVKSGRASLLLGAGSVLASSANAMDETDFDVSLLNDLVGFCSKVRSNADEEKHNDVKASKSNVGCEVRHYEQITGTYKALKRSIDNSKFSLGGLIMSFGKADHGKLGHGDIHVHRSVPTVIESMKHSNIVRIASMSTYSVVVDDMGGVYVWGTGSSASTLQGLRTDILPQPLDALTDKVPMINAACGLGHALFLSANGDVFSWGNGGNGRLGLGDTADRAEACLVRDLVGQTIVSIYCGASHSMAITKKEGLVYTWGKNSQGQCGRGNLEDVMRPTLVSSLRLEPIVKMAAGWEHTIALSARGALYSWGSGYKDSRRGLVPPVLGLGHSEGRTMPEILTSIDDIRMIDIASGWDHCLALDSKHRVFSWGSGQNGKLGHNSEENITAPCIIPSLEMVHVVHISAGCEHSGAISASGELFTWGHGDGGRLGHGDNEARSVPTCVESLKHMNARPISLHCGDKFTMVAVEPHPFNAEESDDKPTCFSENSIDSEDGDVFSMTWVHDLVDKRVISKGKGKTLKGHNSDSVISGNMTLEEIDRLSKAKLSKQDDCDCDQTSMEEVESSNISISGSNCKGREILLSMLSLMARCMHDGILQKSDRGNSNDRNIHLPLAFEYTVEVSVQLFQSILMILTLQSEELFKIRDDNSSHSNSNSMNCLDVGGEWAKHGLLKQEELPGLNTTELPNSFVTWSTLRCALLILRWNLRVLHRAGEAETRKDWSFQGSESYLVDLRNRCGDILSVPGEESKGSLSASGRLATLLGVRLSSNLDECDDMRSSSDEDVEEDDDDEDEDDTDDDEDDDDDDEEEEDEDDLQENAYDLQDEDDEMDISRDLLDVEAAKLARAVMSMMEGGESDHDIDHSYGDEYDIGQDMYDNDDEVDLNGNDTNESGVDGSDDASSENNNDKPSENNGRNIDDEVESSNNANDDHKNFIVHDSDNKTGQTESLVVNSSQMSPAASQDNLSSQDKQGDVEMHSSDCAFIESQGEVRDFQNEEGDDLQRAIDASMEEYDSFNVLQQLLQSKQVFKTNEVLPLLGKQLEYISRLCFNKIKSSIESDKSCGDAPALIEFWNELQDTIATGFQCMYSANEKRELVSYCVKNPEDWIHMIPCVASALIKDEFMLASIASPSCHPKPINKRKGKVNFHTDDSEREGAKCSEPDSSYSVNMTDISLALKNMSKIGMSWSSVVDELFQDFDTSSASHSSDHEIHDRKSFTFCQYPFARCLQYNLMQSNLDIMRSFISFFLMKHFAQSAAAVDASDTLERRQLSDIIDTAVEVIALELQEIAATIPLKVSQLHAGNHADQLPVKEYYSIHKAFQNSVASKLLSCLGGFFLCNRFSIRHVTLFLPYAMRLIHIYHQSHKALHDASARFQHILNIGNVLQEWLLLEMRWVLLFVSSAVNLLLSVNNEKNLGKLKSFGNTSADLFTNIFYPLIDVSNMLSSAKQFRPNWKNIDATVRHWCCLFLEEGITPQDIFDNCHDVNNNDMSRNKWDILQSDLMTTCVQFAETYSHTKSSSGIAELPLFKSWFVDTAAFFSHHSVEWLSRFDLGMVELATLCSIEANILAIVVSSAVDFHPHFLHHDDPFIEAFIKHGNELSGLAMKPVVSKFGNDFGVLFKKWVNLLRIYVFALLCHFFELDQDVEMLYEIGFASAKSSTKKTFTGEEANRFSSSLTDVWYLTVIVTCICVKSTLSLALPANGCSRFVIRRMLSTLHNSLDLTNASLKSFKYRSLNYNIRMVNTSSSEFHRVSNEAKMLTSYFELIQSDFKSFNTPFCLKNLNSMMDSNSLCSIALLKNVAAVPMFLLSGLSVSFLENASVVTYICHRSVLHGIQVCTEVLSSLRGSHQAMAYFSAALEISYVKSSSIPSNFCYDQSKSSHNSLTVGLFGDGETKHSSTSIHYQQEKKRSQVVNSLDNCISEFYAEVSKKLQNYGSESNTFDSIRSLVLFPKLMGVLHFGVKMSLEYCPLKVHHSALISPSLGMKILLEFLQKLLQSMKANQNTAFWRVLSIYREYLLSVNLLQNIIGELNGANCTSFVSSEKGIDILRICDISLKLVENVSAGLFDLKLSTTRQFAETDTKLYIPQMRLIDYSSPIVIPNACTQNGDYSIGFWIKIPNGYKRCGHFASATSSNNADCSPRSNLQANHSVKKSTHILSRVPEAGEVDMKGLFQGLPTTLCNPGVVLEVLPDGTALLVVSITSTVDSEGNQASQKIRVVKLSSKSLPYDSWVDVSIRFTSAISTEDMSSKSKKSFIQLFVDSELHSAAEDAFGRMSLHQNVVFGTIPSSLIKPSTSSSCLLAGGLRWSPQSLHEAHSSNRCCPHDDTLGSMKITLTDMSAKELNLPSEPFSYTQETLWKLSDIAQFTLHTCSIYFVNSTREALKRLNSSLENAFRNDMSCPTSPIDAIMSKQVTGVDIKALECIESLLDIQTSVSSRAICLFGIATSNHTLQDTIFRLFSVGLDVLASIKSFLDANSKAIHSIVTNLRNSMQEVSAALQLQVRFMLDVVEVLVDQAPSSLSEETKQEGSSGKMKDKSIPSILEKWLMRVRCSNIVLEESIYPCDSVSTWVHSKDHRYRSKTNENALVSSIASIIAKALNAQMIPIFKVISSTSNEISRRINDVRSPSAHILLSIFVAGGGWPVSIQHGSIVDLSPRAMFLHHDVRGLEHSIFPSTATVQSVSPISGIFGGGTIGGVGQGSMSIVASSRQCGVWLQGCDGLYGHKTLSLLKLLASSSPKKDKSKTVHFASEKMSSVENEKSQMNSKRRVCVLGRSVLIPHSTQTIIQSTELVSARDNFVPLAMPHFAQVLQMSPLVDSSALVSMLLRLSRLSSSNSDHEISMPSASNSASKSDSDANARPSLQLTICLSHMRSLLIQLATVECLDGIEKANHLKLLEGVLERDFDALISVALLDPVSSVVQCFRKASTEQQPSGDGTNDSSIQQLDVLSNLLREGDISFLEKISLRVWRQFRNGRHVSKSSNHATDFGDKKYQPSAIQGDVQINGNRIRALSHFPSIKICPVSLEKMSGRWFYECTLLTDGLMQIGWADRSFRADPICGQGVGDHLHSWAVDGLRTKKWNVSCETYGTKWKVEDVIGVLVDMDLLEMKYFINGVDLGTAFTDFQAVGLYPAISLNVRQCLRVNYGQEKFLYPPDSVDKLPFRPVAEALHWKSSSDRKDKDISSSTSDLDIQKEETKGRVTVVTSESINPGNMSARVQSTVPGRRPSRGNVTAGDNNPRRNGGNETETTQQANSNNTNTESTDMAGLEESLDERRSREGIHIDQVAESNTDANAWTEMGQNLSRRGSRAGLTPRASTNEITGLEGNPSSQRFAAATSHTESNDPNENSNTEESKETGQSSSEYYRRHPHQSFQHPSQVTMSGTEFEARRQQLVENLIGMGFPIEWSMRAAEHCDANISESVAIAWIIERMEMEHAKMEELDGGEDSRMVEDVEDGDEGHEDESNIGINRPTFAFQTGDVQDASKMSEGMSSYGALTKPAVKPPMGSAATKKGSYLARSSKTNQLNLDSFTGSASSEGGYQEQGTWNNEKLAFATILVGQKSARRRFDVDKQAVLSQISELELSDLFPIVLSCQFSLCIFYARCAFVRIIRIVLNILNGSSSHSSKILKVTDESLITSDMQSSAENLLGMLVGKPTASSASNSAFSVSSLINLLEICFKEGQSASNQPDRLFPSLLQGTTTGDPIDTCPTAAQFLSENSRALSKTLCSLEMEIFARYENSAGIYDREPKVFSSIASDESSLQSSSSITSLINLISTRIVSLYHNSQGVNHISNVKGDAGTGDASAFMSCKFLASTISSCVCAFEQAVSDVYDRKDWVSSGSEKTIQENSVRPKEFGRNEDASHKPYIFWAHTAFITMLHSCRAQEIRHPNSFVRMRLQALHAPDSGSLSSPIEDLASPEILIRMIELSNRTVNMSFNYCVYNVCWAMVNRLNRHLMLVKSLLADPEVESKLRGSDDTHSLLPESFPVIPLLNQWEKKLREQGESIWQCFHSVYHLSSTNAFYQHMKGGFTSEFKLLKISSHRLLTENMHYRKSSRFLRESISLLSELRDLERHVYPEYFTNRPHPLHCALFEDVVHDWRSKPLAALTNTLSQPNAGDSMARPGKTNPISSGTGTVSPTKEQLVNEATTSLDVSPTARASNHDPSSSKSTIEVSQIPTLALSSCNSTSLTVTWSNIPEDGDWTDEHLKLDVSKDVKGSEVSLTSLVGGFLAASNQPSSSSAQSHTPFSLFIAPVHRTMPLSSSRKATVAGENDADAQCNQDAVLTLPFVAPSGTHKIDMLEPDTLYMVFLSSSGCKAKDDDTFSNDNTSSSKQSSFNKSLTSWGSTLLSTTLRGSQYSKKESSVSSALMSSTTPSPISLPKNDDKEFTSSGNPESAIDETISSAKDPKANENQIAILASTTAKPLVLFDGSVGGCPPQLKVTHHGLTVRNTMNKKWSTVRSPCRLYAGIHQWEVYIDRCISKNIFIGVISPEARVDNYVGYDKHGWAFLANRAIWYNKGKMKSYGELFKTGDVVQVTMDFDNGGSLSFSINGKDLGVAVEGLTGPLSPAFSLYNEDDQISLSPPHQPFFLGNKCSRSETGAAKPNTTRVCDGCSTSSSIMLHSQTASAERLVQRLESLRSLIRFIAAGKRYVDDNQSYSSEQFLSTSLVQELSLRWNLWKENSILRTIRTEDGDIVTVIVSSELCLAISDNRYCPGDLVQWEQEIYVVLGVGRHKLWFQKSSGCGEVIGLYRDCLQHLHLRNLVRLVKKKSSLHRLNKSKTPSVLHQSTFSDSFEKTESGEYLGDRKAGIVEDTECDDGPITESALLASANSWSRADDSCLIEWLDLRARVLAIHPLHLSMEQVTSPDTVLKAFQNGDSEPECVLDDSSTHPKAYKGTVSEFVARFSALREKSMMEIKLRALLLLHINDAMSPLLPVVFDSKKCQRGSGDLFDIMSPLDDLIASSRHIILLETKMTFGFRLGWANVMSHSMLEGGASHATTILEKESLGNDPQQQQQLGGTQNPDVSELMVSSQPVELPVIPHRDASRGNSTGDHKSSASCKLPSSPATSLNVLSNPLHLSNLMPRNESDALNSGSTSVETRPKLQSSSIYYYDESSSFFKWSVQGQSSLSQAAPTSAGGNRSTLLALPALNVILFEPSLIASASYDLARKNQTKYVFDRDERWRLLSSFQFSLLGQFMQSLEQCDMNQNVALNSSNSISEGKASLIGDDILMDVHASTVVVPPRGPWAEIVRSVFRSGLFWDEHLSPSNRPVSVHVHYTSTDSEEPRKEARGGKRDRHVSSNGALDSARSVSTTTPRVASSHLHEHHGEADATLRDEEHEKEDGCKAPHHVSFNSTRTDEKPTRRLRKFQVLQGKPKESSEQKSGVSPWCSLQAFVVDAVAEIQPLLDSPLVASSKDFEHMSMEELAEMYSEDVLCGLLARQAGLLTLSGERCSLAGMVNIHLHVMHSLGVLLGVSLRHGIVANIRMSSYFWEVLSHSTCLEKAPIHSGDRKLQSARKLFSEMREACARCLKHGLMSIIPEDFLDLLEEYELRGLLTGGGCTNIEHMRRNATYLDSTQDSDVHVEMFWMALSDMPKTAVVRFLQAVWCCEDRDRSDLPDELFHWSNTSSSVKPIHIADISHSLKDKSSGRECLSSKSSSRDSPGIQLLLESDKRVVCLPRCSSLDLMRSKLVALIESL